MKKFLVLMIVVAVIGTAGLLSCDSSGGGDTGELAGTWLATGEDAGVGKAVIFELSSSSFKRTALTESVDDMYQEEGQMGLYGISGSNFTVTVTSEWDEISTSWAPANENVVIPYSYDGTTLTLEVEPGLLVPFTRIIFSQHANLAGTTWGGGVLLLNNDGTYTADDGVDTYTGIWSATADMLRTVTTSENGSSMYMENLYDYEIQGAELVLLWDGDVKQRY